MKKLAIQLLTDAAIWISIIGGGFYGITELEHVLTFIVGLCFAVSIFCFIYTKQIVESVKERIYSPVSIEYVMVTSIAEALVMASVGWFWLASLWVFSALVIASIKMNIKGKFDKLDEITNSQRK